MAVNRPRCVPAPEPAAAVHAGRQSALAKL